MNNALRDLRIAAGFSQETLAHAIEASSASVRAWENAERVPRPTYRPRLAAALGVTLGDLARIFERATTAVPTNGLTPQVEGLNLFIRSEAVAAGIADTATTALPALTQTRAYALGVESAGHREPTPADIGRYVDLRMSRQLVLERPDPPTYRALIPQWLLDSPHVDRPQLARLNELADRPTIDLRIIGGEHMLPVAATFTLIWPPGSDEPTLATEFGANGPAYHEGALAVHDLARLFDHLSGRALNRQETQAVIVDRLHKVQENP